MRSYHMRWTGVFGWLVLLALPTMLPAQQVEADSSTGHQPFSLALLEMNVGAVSRYDDKGQMNRHAKLTVNSKWMLRNHSTFRMIRARQVELAELTTDPPTAQGQFSPDLKNEMDLYSWYASPDEGIEPPLAEQVELQSHVIASFVPVREILSLKIGWEVMYATGRPREVKLAPLGDHLDKWIGVEDIPALRVKVTREAIGNRQEFYDVQVNTPAMHHLWSVRFVGAQGQPVEPLSPRGHVPQRTEDPMDSPISSYRFVFPNGQVNHIVLEVYPKLQTMKVLAHASHVPVLRPLSDQDKPTVILELE